MQLELLLNQPKYSLPAKNFSGKPFVSFIEETLNDYLSDLKKSPDLLNGIQVTLLDYSELYDTIEELSIKIIETIKLALRNKTAYDLFAKTMESLPILSSNFGSSSCVIRRSDVLFRSKFFDNTTLKNQDYFFHTPFHHSDKVKSTRFSSSGIPSLYLSNSLILGYLETNANTLNKFQSVKFQTKYPETFLDLDFTKPSISLKTTNLSSYEEQLQTKALLYPLLLACYTLKPSIDLANPQEYIIPQLLTRWVSEASKLYIGIRYPTTKIDSSNSNYMGRFFNYILPVICYENEGYCKILKSKLNMSQVCSNYINNTEIQDYYNNNFSRVGIVNNDISTIEWNRNRETYNSSEIGKMEFYINKALPIQKINF